MNTEISPRKMRMKKGIYILPNLFTSASLFCGFYSIIASFKEHFVPASIAILFAVVFD
jgi:CDP-diacylglycerol--serine O-phosphatidyltransferase